MTTHELARHLLKMPDIRVNVQHPNEYKTIEVIKYAANSSDEAGRNNLVLRGESYKDEVMKTMQTSNAKANTLDRARLISPSGIKAFEEYTDSFKAMLVSKYQWTVKKANDFTSSELKDCFEEGLSVQKAYYKIFEIPEPQQEVTGDSGVGKDEQNKPIYLKDDVLQNIRAKSVEEAVEKMKEMLFEKEKTIPDGIPHSIWIYGLAIQWDYHPLP